MWCKKMYRYFISFMIIKYQIAHLCSVYNLLLEIPGHQESPVVDCLLMSCFYMNKVQGLVHQL